MAEKVGICSQAALISWHALFGWVLCAAGSCSILLRQVRARVQQVMRAIWHRRGQGAQEKVEGNMTKKEWEKLCTTDLTDPICMDPVIGRDAEIQRCIHALCRRTENNALLLGESGVGKTAIVRGLAQRIVNNDVPERLKGFKILELDVSKIKASSRMGDLAVRLKKDVIEKLVEHNVQAVLFIDDLHSLLPPDAAAQGAGLLDCSTLLKNTLSGGQLRCIGATTTEMCRKTISKDPALERCFQQVYIEEPTVDQTISILRGLRKNYEEYHAVKISESALMNAAKLSARYINGRYLPEKAIALIDEASAQVRIEVDLKKSGTVELLEKRIKQKEMEKASLEGILKTDKHAHSCLNDIHKALAKHKEELSEEQHAFNARAEAATKELGRQGSAMFVPAASAQFTKVEPHGPSASRADVTEGDVAKVITLWTGIPTSKLVAGSDRENQKLLELAEELHRRIKGQDDAVRLVAEAIQRSRADLAPQNSPIASFMFLGPTGVGKTELAKALAAFLFSSEEALIRLDMSEYQEKNAVSRLIGAPPGYVGYDDGGLLTDAVRHKPYSVVLFDEFEKAHKAVSNVLLQILDDGRSTDSQGRTVSFQNTLIIMTSNVGAAEIIDGFNPRRSQNKEEITKRVQEALRGYPDDMGGRKFSPEFLNRIDEFIIFEPLSMEQIKDVVKLEAQRLVQRLESERHVRLKLEDTAVDHLAKAGYDPEKGARPVKRALKRELQTLLAKELLAGKFEAQDTIIVRAAEEPGRGVSRLQLIKGPKVVSEVACAPSIPGARRLQQLIQLCFQLDPSDRPSAEAAKKLLQGKPETVAQTDKERNFSDEIRAAMMQVINTLRADTHLSRDLGAPGWDNKRASVGQKEYMSQVAEPMDLKTLNGMVQAGDLPGSADGFQEFERKLLLIGSNYSHFNAGSPSSHQAGVAFNAAARKLCDQMFAEVLMKVYG